MTQVAPYGAWVSPISAEMVAVDAVVVVGAVARGRIRVLAGEQAGRGRTVVAHARGAVLGAGRGDSEGVQRSNDRARVRRRRLPDPRRHGVLLELRRPTALPPGARHRSGGDHAGVGRPGSIRGRAGHAGRTMVDLRPGAPPRPRRPVRRHERARGDPARRVGRARVDPLGSRLLLHAAVLARRIDVSAGSSGICRGCPGTDARCTSPSSHDDGSLENVRLVAGRAGEESIFQPAWSPAGDLHFVSDRTGWWNLYRERDGRVEPLHPAEAEFGWPQWLFGMASYGFLEDGRIVCLWDAGRCPASRDLGSRVR